MEKCPEYIFHQLLSNMSWRLLKRYNFKNLFNVPMLRAGCELWKIGSIPHQTGVQPGDSWVQLKTKLVHSVEAEENKRNLPTLELFYYSLSYLS